MQNHDNFIFVGIKISDRLRDDLDSTTASMKPFFRDNNPEYLQVIQIDNNEYIGKVIKSGVSFEKLGNIRMNVKTMLKMISPKFFFNEDAIMIYVHSPKPSRIYY